MEGKKEPIKINLSTAIIIFIMIPLIVGIAYLANENMKLKMEKNKTINTGAPSPIVENIKDKSNNIVIEENSSVNEINTSNNVITENTTTKEETATKKTTSNNENKKQEEKKIASNEITNELDKNDVFKLTSFEKDGGNYILKGEIYTTPYTISKEEYNNAIKSKKMTLNNGGYSQKYIVKKSEDYNDEYGLFPEKYPDVQWYRIRKNDKGYYIEGLAEYSNVYKIKEKDKQITLDGKTKCTYTKDGDEEKTDTVANVFSKKLYNDGGIGACFKFDFKNEKCIAVNEFVTGN